MTILDNAMGAPAFSPEHNPQTCFLCILVGEARRTKAERLEKPRLPQDNPPEPTPFLEYGQSPAKTYTEDTAAFVQNVPEMEPVPAKPKGNRQRESVFRVVIAVEKALKSLPKSAARVAGYLQGQGFVGRTRSDDNALAVYLKNGINAYWTEGNLWEGMKKVNVLVDANAIIVENEEYQVILTPPGWLDTFVVMLRTNEYPELLV